jgi:hypothetical protein
MRARNGQGPRTMRRRIGLLIAGVAVALMAGVGTALAATFGPVDSGGVIHGCWTKAAVNGSHVFKLQDAGTKCPNGTTAISWNQKGPAGPRGATGPAGTPGPAGPGFDFTTASGTTGPVVPATGTYLVDVLFDASNESETGFAGECSVGLPSDIPTAHAVFSGAFVVPPGTTVFDESVSGIVSVTDQALAGEPFVISCVDPSGNPVSVSGVQWYMSSVQTRT